MNNLNELAQQRQLDILRENSKELFNTIDNNQKAINKNNNQISNSQIQQHRKNNYGSFYGKYGDQGVNRTSNPVDLGKSNYESINVSHKLKALDKGNKIQIKRQNLLDSETPAQYYPNHQFRMRMPETHKFSKAMRTSSVLASALKKDYNVEIGDPSFTLIKTNVAPGQYDPRPMTTTTELGTFAKTKRIEMAGFVNYAPGPGSYNVKEPVIAKGFIITHAIDNDECTNDGRNIGPGRYSIKHTLQEKRVQGFNQDDIHKKSRSKNSTINYLREKYSTNEDKIDKKQKIVLNHILTESIERHTNKSFYILKEREERNGKVNKVLSQSIHIEQQRAKSLENKSRIKQLRKLLLNQEDKNSILSAFINLALREKLKKNIYNEYIIYKDHKGNLEKTKRFLMKNKLDIKRNITLAHIVTKSLESKQIETNYNDIEMLENKDLNENELIKSCEDRNNTLIEDDNQSNDKLDDNQSQEIVDDDLQINQYDESVFHNQNEKSRENLRYNN